MRRFVIVVALVAVGLVVVPGGAAAQVQIDDWNDLDNMRNQANSNYELTQNLTPQTAGYSAVASPSANGGKGWEPIFPWSSNFDGQGYTIDGVYVNRPALQYGALFEGGSGDVSDVVLTDVNITAKFASGAVSFVRGTVSNVHVSGEVHGSSGAGGVAALVSGTVEGSSANVDVNGAAAGGLVAGIDNGGHVSESYAVGAATGGGSGAGGIVGRLIDGSIEDVYSGTTVNGSGNVGGLVGTIQTGNTVSNAFAYGEVKNGGSNVGGLVGSNSGTLSGTYWDINATNQTSGVGSGGSAGATGLTTDAMTGNVYSTMPALDYSSTWKQIAAGRYNTDWYPILRTLDEERQLNLAGVGTKTNIPIITHIMNGDVWRVMTYAYAGVIPQVLFVGIVCSVILAGIYINSRSIVLTAITAMLAGGSVVGFMPPEVRTAGYLLIVGGVAAVLASMYTGQERPVRR